MDPAPIMTPELNEALTSQYASLQCPSDTTVKTNWSVNAVCTSWVPNEGFSRGSYAGNFGQSDPDIANSAGMERPGHIDGVFGFNFGIRLDRIGDGTSNTLMTSELIPGGICSLRGTWWFDEGPVFMQEYTPNDPTPDIVRRCDDEDQSSSSRAPCASGLTEWNMIVHTARSCHPGGVVSGMCDGSVEFVTDNISLVLWRAMGTPNGGEVLSEETD